eukprot:328207_1
MTLMLLLIYALLMTCNMAISNITLFVDPSTTINSILGNDKNEPIEPNTFNYTKWCGHHALNESYMNISTTMKKINTFASRWLNNDLNYFPSIPQDRNNPGYADLSWFQHPNNIKLVLAGYPKYLVEYGNDKNVDLIYCLSGQAWPWYMLNKSDPHDSTPNNLEAATQLVTSSLQTIYEQTGSLPKYFEPYNEPNNGITNVSATDIRKMQYEQYVLNAVSELFSDKGVVVGGPVISEVGWMDKHDNTLIWNETFKYLIGNDVNHTLQFISWHQFSKFVQNKKGKWLPMFWCSGTVHSTFDLIESYTNYIYGKPIKILLSEHGMASKEEMESGDWNVSYMQYIAVQTHLTDVLNFLDRPESQLKANSFLLTTNNQWRVPINLVYYENDTLTPTSIVYNIWTMLMQNGGNKVNTSVDFSGNHKIETIKLHSYYNNNTQKLIVILKEISWNDTYIRINIGSSTSNNHYNALRVYWDVNKAEFVGKNVTLNSLDGIYLHSGETMIIYGIDYSLNENKNNVCRKRYYLDNFEIYNIVKNVDGYMMNMVVDNNIIGNGILRVGMNWNFTNSYTVSNVEPIDVKMDNHSLPLSLKRIDNLVQRPRVWTAFEYEIKKEYLLANQKHSISLQFTAAVPYSYITSIVCEIHFDC